jgi:hypothetical protein
MDHELKEICLYQKYFLVSSTENENYHRCEITINKSQLKNGNFEKVNFRFIHKIAKSD